MTGPRMPARDDEICRLYRTEGLSITLIGNRYGISRQRVQQILKRSGISKIDRPINQRHWSRHREDGKPVRTTPYEAHE